MADRLIFSPDTIIAAVRFLKDRGHASFDKLMHSLAVEASGRSFQTEADNLVQFVLDHQEKEMPDDQLLANAIVAEAIDCLDLAGFQPNTSMDAVRLVLSLQREGIDLTYDSKLR